MADNVDVDNGDLTDFTVATDKIAGVDWQYVKLAYGSDGTATIVDATHQVPVLATQTGTWSVTSDTELTTADLDTGAGTDTRAVVGIVLGASGGGELLPGDATNGAKVQITQMPGAASTTDSIASAVRTDVIHNNLTALTPKFAAISAASSGNNTAVAAVTSKIIRVTNIFLMSAGSVNVTFQSAAGGTALTGAIPLAANVGFAPGFDPTGHFQTASGALLNISLSAAVGVYGWLKYVEV